MELEIDESYANNFNDWKMKEDSSKLKKKLKSKIKELEEESSSSSDSEDEEESKAYRESYVNQVDNLLKELREKGVAAQPMWTTSEDKPAVKEKKTKPIFAKELNVNMLLKNDKDDETFLRKIDEISKADINFHVKKDFTSLVDNCNDLLVESKIDRKVELVEEESVSEDEEESSGDGDDDEEDPRANKESTIVLNTGRHGDSLRPGSTKRKDKRSEKREKKKAEKKEIMNRLKSIQLQEMEKIYEKIRRNNPEIVKFLRPEDLDEDFDADKLAEVMERMHKMDDDEFEVDEEKPVFSEDEDFDYGSGGNDEEEEEEGREGAKKVTKVEREKKEEVVDKKKKSSRFTNVESLEEEKKQREVYDPAVHGSFKSFMKNHVPIVNTDVIKGANGEEIVCRFKYRSVVPQDFGLTTEEILFAEKAELNRWASLKKVTRLRTQEEEEKDRRKYQSEKKLSKKMAVLASLYKENEEEEVDRETEEREEAGEGKHKKRRMRKALKRKMEMQQIEEEEAGKKAKVDSEEEEVVHKEKRSKKIKKKEETAEKSNGEPAERSEVKKDKKASANQKDSKEDKNKKNKEAGGDKKRRKEDKGPQLPQIASDRLKGLHLTPGYYVHLKAEKKKEKKAK